MIITLGVRFFLLVLVLAWVGERAGATIMTKAFLLWTKDQYFLNGSSFHGWCPLEGSWFSPWNSAEVTVRMGQVKSLVRLGTSEELRGQVGLAHNTSTTAIHLRGEPIKDGKKQLYVADLTCARVGNKDHLYVVVLPAGGLRTKVAFYDMIRGEPGSRLKPPSSDSGQPTVYLAEKEAIPNPL